MKHDGKAPAAHGMSLGGAIAVIGMSCRFPGAASPGEFWRNLDQGVDSIREIPADRWDASRFSLTDGTSGLERAKWGGFLDGIDQFDHRFFQISPREAQSMDPQQRLLLEESWRCLEDSGIGWETISKVQSSVFIGMMPLDHYFEMAGQESEPDGYACSGTYGCILANRVSYFLKLRGISTAVDAACASSLVALHQARGSLLAGESEYALVGAANLNLHPWKYLSFSKARMLSPDGRCRTFDKRANGYVPGEGVAVLLLECLENAQRRGHHIYGVIRGSAVNHGGRAVSLTAPRVEAQQEAIEEAYRAAGVKPSTISYIEAHGTGTSLGDPIEIEALTRAFRRETAATGYCRIGSVKTNIGHLEAAAGLAGLIKVLLMLKHKRIPPTLNLEEPNPLIDFAKTPFVPAMEGSDWIQKKGARRAGVSSFGFGGVNAHVVVEEWAENRRVKRNARARDRGFAFVLSAPSEAALGGLVERWKAFCDSEEIARYRLEDICRTLQLGRESFGCRLGGYVRCIEDIRGLIQKGGGSTPEKHGPGGWVLRLGTGGRLDRGWAVRWLTAEPGLESVEKAWREMAPKTARRKGILAALKHGPKELVEFVLGYCLGRKLWKGCGSPSLVTGEGSGQWAAVALSGMAPLTDCLGEVIGRRRLKRVIALKRPECGFFDPASGRTIQPIASAAIQLPRLRIKPEFGARLVRESAEFFENQATFRRFVEEWEGVCAARGLDIGAELKRGGHGEVAEVAQVLVITLLTCWRKLHRKWNLSERFPETERVLSDLVDLIAGGWLTREDALGLAEGTKEDLEKAAACLAGVELARFEENCWVRAFRSAPLELDNLDQWLEGIGSAECRMDLARAWTVIDAGAIGGEVFAGGDRLDPLKIAFTPGAEEALDRGLLGLWRDGGSVRWEDFADGGNDSRVPLPVSAFVGFQFPRRLSVRLGKLAEGAVTGQETDWKRGTDGGFVLEIAGQCEEFLRDHGLAGSEILPGALYLALIARAAVEGQGAKGVELRAIRFLQMRELSAAGELEIRAQADGAAEVLASGKILCSGHWSGARTGRPRMETEADRVRGGRTWQGAAIEDLFRRHGYTYGPAFSQIKAARADERWFEVELKELGAEVPRWMRECIWMDAAFQAAIAGAYLVRGAEVESCLHVPVGVERILVSAELSAGQRVRVLWSSFREHADGFEVESSVLDRDGVESIRLEGIRFKRVSAAFFGGPSEESLVCLRPVWTPLTEGEARVFPGVTVVCGPDGTLVRSWGEELRRAGANVTLARNGREYQFGRECAQIDGMSESHWRRLWRDLRSAAEHSQWRLTIVYVAAAGALNGNRAAEGIEAEVFGIPFRMLKALAIEAPDSSVDFLGIAAEVFAIGGGDSCAGFAASAWEGLLRSAQLEMPRLTFSLFDLDAGAIQDAAEGCKALCGHGLSGNSGWFGWRRGRSFGRTHRAVSWRNEGPHEDDHEPWSSGTTVITGGAGAMGLQLAGVLAGYGERQIALVGRSELDPERRRKITELERTGAAIRYFRADVSDGAAVELVLQKIRACFGPITAVIHAAGIVEDGYLATKELDSAMRVWAPKARGVWNLNELTQRDPLRRFVVCSSVVSAIGNAGQSDYAAANGYLDGFAGFRMKGGFPGKTLVIGWPFWSDGGMGQSERVRRQLAERGIAILKSGEGGELFKKLLGAEAGHMLVHRGAAFEKLIGSKSQVRPVELAATEREGAKDKSGAGLKGGETLADWVAELVASKIGSRPEELSREESFFSLGIESLLLNEIQEALEKHFESLPPTLLFEQPNIAALARFLEKQRVKGKAMAGSGAGQGSPAKIGELRTMERPRPGGGAAVSERVLSEISEPVAKAESGGGGTDRIAIVGRHGRFPMAPDLAAFWKNLREGRNCIEEIPRERWEWLEFFDPDLESGESSYGKWGGFLEEVDRFDPLFFNISPQEAEWMDPQQRLLLESAWSSLEDGGYAAAKRRAALRVGLFVGSMWSEYSLFCHEHGFLKNRYGGPGSQGWAMANRISYFLDFRGPSLAIDTACSSSLVAVHLACRSLLSGECEMALAGGVNLSLHPSKYSYLSQARFLSKDGLCRSFGEGGSGYVPGEGVGTVLLKRLDRALADGDRIYGVIRSSATNHGGRATGYTVPNPEAHESLIADALQRAGVRPSEISYVECHGTGTALGDPVEIRGLAGAFLGGNLAKQSCWIGSVKSNIGHLEAAAGIAGLMKVLGCFEHGELPKTLHCEEPNSRIRFEETPFKLVRETTVWPSEPGKLRMAGLSSFGAGGSNAHLILEEFPGGNSSRTGSAGVEQLVCVSARTEERLRVLMGSVADVAESRSGAGALPAFEDFVYSLNTGRESFEVRWAGVCGSYVDLAKRIRSFLGGEGETSGWFGRTRDRTNPHRLEMKSAPLGVEDYRSLNLDRIGRWWAGGEAVDWEQFYHGHCCQRVSVPQYPFKRERYWILGETSKVNAPGKKLASAEGRGLDGDGGGGAGAGRVGERRLELDWDRIEAGHWVGGKPIVPGAFLLQAAAARQEGSGEDWAGFSDVVWMQPLECIRREVLAREQIGEGCREFTICSSENGSERVHARGKIWRDGWIRSGNGRGESLVQRADNRGDGTAAQLQRIEKRDIYAAFERMGFQYGAGFQVIESAAWNENEARARIGIGGGAGGGAEGEWDPVLIDGAFQSCLILLLNQAREGSLRCVPFSLGEMRICRRLPQDIEVRVQRVLSRSEGERRKEVERFDLELRDLEGTRVGEIRDFCLRLRVEEEKASSVTAFFRPVLQEAQGGDEKAMERVMELLKAPDCGLLLLDRGRELFNQIEACLASSGTEAGKVVLVQLGKGFAKRGANIFEVDPKQPDPFGLVVRSLIERGWRTIQFADFWLLRPKDGTPSPGAEAWAAGLDGRLTLGLRAVFHWIKAVLGHGQKAELRGTIWLDAKSGPEADAIAGLCRTAAVENPLVQLKMVKVRESAIETGTLARLWLSECAGEKRGEAEVEWIDGKRWARGFELAAAEGGSGEQAGSVFRKGGAYWITGGAGGLGLVVARYLAERYGARLMLSGRAAPSLEIEARVEELRRLGAEAFYVSADVTQQSKTDDAARLARERFGRIQGVIHSAGVIEDSLLRNKSAEGFDRVIAPKIFGAVNLDESTRQDPLDLFVMFSSFVGATGNIGQSDYASGNRFLDAFAALREDWVRRGERSGRTLSIGWPFWKEGGMQISVEAERLMRRRMGLEPLSTERGLAALEECLARAQAEGVTHFVVGHGEIGQMSKVLGKGVGAEPEAAVNQGRAAAAAPVSGEAAELREQVGAALRSMISGILKVSAADIDEDNPLGEYGFDSVTFTQFAERINEKYGIAVMPPIFFEHDSVRALAEYMAVEHAAAVRGKHDLSAPKSAKGSEAAAARADRTAGKGVEAADPAGARCGTASADEGLVAIIGAAGVFPGSHDLAALWRNILSGAELITEIPRQRWDWRNVFGDAQRAADAGRCKWGGFCDEMDCFDPLFFGISPREAEMMDPQQRVFLETVWHALEDAGYRASALAGSRSGLFVGVSTSDYRELLEKCGAPIESHSATGTIHSILPNRISYLLDWRGPSEAVDTACSSSLVAVHRAVAALRHGECQLAVAGGVNGLFSPRLFVAFEKAGMLAPDGKCKTFDRRANGYVRAEGSGAVVLKLLSQALKDGDAIHAVIRATGVNHGGRANSLTAPNSKAQTELLVEVYERAGIDPETVGYVECHGTGTELGDPIEFNSLCKAFRQLKSNKGEALQRSAFCGLGAIKTHVGHLETAAGIAGLLGAMLALRHRKLPAVRNFSEPNPYLELGGSPFFIVSAPGEWEAPMGSDGGKLPRRAGVSSFGFGGVNAHVVLEEFTSGGGGNDAGRELGGGRELVVLSAKSQRGLKEAARNLLAWAEAAGACVEAAPRLEDAAYTLQVGREAFGWRLALVAGSYEELATKLRAYGSGQFDAAQIFSGTNAEADGGALISSLEREDMDFLKGLYANGKLERIGRLWVSGAEVDWQALHAGEERRRVSLPGYPFARERYWPVAVADREPGENGSAANGNGVLKREPAAMAAGGKFELSTVVWERVDLGQDARAWEAFTGEVLIFLDAGGEGMAEALARGFGSAKVLKIRLGRRFERVSEREVVIDCREEEDFARVLAEREGTLEIFFLAGVGTGGESSRLDEDHFRRAQETGVYALFRLVRALARTGRIGQVRGLKVITNRLHEVTGEERELRSLWAGLPGFVRACRTECPDLAMGCIDVDAEAELDWAKGSGAELARCLAGLSMSDGERVMAVRGGEKFAQRLGAVREELSGRVTVRKGGVYILAGGAGGLGQVVARYLLEKFGAHLVLVGQRGLEGERAEEVRALEKFGGSVMYLAGDIRRRDFAREVFERAKERHGTVHGVFHMAAIMRDAGLMRMAHEDFAAVVEAGGLSTLQLLELAKGEAQDFCCIFSSAGALVGVEGTANYAAACSLKDGLGLDFRKQVGCAVQVVNWGYWGGTGLVADSRYGAALPAMGIYPISHEEGLRALEEIFRSGCKQVLAARIGGTWLERQKLAARVDDGTANGERGPWGGMASAKGNFDRATEAARALHGRENSGWSELEPQYEALERYCGAALFRALRGMGFAFEPGADVEVERVRKEMKIIDEHARLFGALMGVLVKHDFLRCDSGRMIATARVMDTEDGLSRAMEFEQGRIAALGNDLAPHLAMAGRCLAAFGKILRGEERATEVIFPDGCMDGVTALYSGNRMMDGFNAMVGEAIRAFGAEKGSGIFRVLEIGAGTGSTTVAAARALSGLAGGVEYFYTDVSRHFLGYGRERFGAAFPFLKFELLDIESGSNCEALGKELFDAVIAANVVHATRDLGATLENARRLLRPGGLLVLSEMTAPESYLTVIFGLLPGWWRFEDEKKRQENSPLVSVATWKEELRLAGFGRVTMLSGGRTGASAEPRQTLILAEAAEQERRWVNGESRLGDEPLAASNPGGAGNGWVEARNGSKNGHGADGLLLVEEKIRAVLAGVLKIAPEMLKRDLAFGEVGVDSLVSIQAAAALNAALQITLRKTDLYNYPTIAVLARHIEKTFGWRAEKEEKRGDGGDVTARRNGASPVSKGETDGVPRVTERRRGGEGEAVAGSGLGVSERRSGAIAVIGMSARFPGARDLGEFWRNLTAGRTAIREIPRERWDIDAYYDRDPLAPNKTYSKWGGFLERVDEFDPLFFNISPEEAKVMDPQQRLFLEEAWKALEDAGQTSEGLSGRRCGVFVGAAQGDYAAMLREGGRLNESHASIGNSCAILPARISYFLNLKGPCLVIDTGCSSALVAFHQACQSLWTGESELALVGGVSALNTPDWHIFFSKSGMASASGQCKTFDNGADGFVPAEGVAAVVLKPLEAAVRDGDPIRAIVAGCGINQDGKTSGITAPSSTSQTELEISVYEKSGINPETIGYVEAHGTGTKLGDPIEVHALTDAFRKFTQKKQYCALGSVKTNIGHTLACAGLAGLIKAVLCVERKQIPASQNYQQANEHIDFGSSPFYVPTVLRDWPSPEGHGRRAAVSSFGFSGTNAHVVVEEWVNERSVANNGKDGGDGTRENGVAFVLPISARSQESLAKRIRELSEWVAEPSRGWTLAELSYTLTQRRSHFEARAAVVAGNMDELRTKLRAYAAGDFSKRASGAEGDGLSGIGEKLRRARDWRGRTGVSEAEQRALLEEIAGLYESGAAMDWAEYWGDEKLRCLAVPAYPFLKERYWLELRQPREQTDTRDRSGAAYEATVEKESGRVRFQIRREDLIVRDHVCAGRIYLPAAAMMDMARFGALRLGLGEAAGLRRLYWRRPVEIEAEKESVLLRLEAGEERRFTLSAVRGEREEICAEGEFLVERNLKDGGRAPLEESPVDINAIVAGCSGRMERAEIYEQFARVGWEYGPAFQTIERLHWNAGEVLARVSLPDGAVGEAAAAFRIFPPLLDGALQSVIGLRLDAIRSGARYFPVSMESIGWRGALRESCWAYAKEDGREEAGGGKGFHKFTIWIMDDGGKRIAEVGGFGLREEVRTPGGGGTMEARDQLFKELFRKVHAREVSVPQAKSMMEFLLP